MDQNFSNNNETEKDDVNEANNNSTNRISPNLILPMVFARNWMNNKTNEFTFLNQNNMKKIAVKLNNIPFVGKIFISDLNFDIEKILVRFNKIAVKYDSLFKQKILNQKKITLSSMEVLEWKYFFFLMTTINGIYKFYFDDNAKPFRMLDVVERRLSNKYNHEMRLILNYILTDFYDKIKMQNFLEDIDGYIRENNYKIFSKTNERVILVPKNFYETRDFRFIDVYFHQLINNTFLKWFSISNLDRERFFLTNNVCANFVDDKTKINILSILPLHPQFAFGVVNLGPGRGEIRPMFKYFKNNRINIEVMPKVLEPDVEILRIGIEINKNNFYAYVPYEFQPRQIELINKSLSIRVVKLAIENIKG
ncbi:hypothetical protein [Spiroplasma endosymbiont of Labia minor]|uniref:hypothetical protein n=1 Tax=Spiroplasma endosymbiont of Labia minor TaxID=3066305 RepID=UPI0030D532C5